MFEGIKKWFSSFGTKLHTAQEKLEEKTVEDAVAKSAAQIETTRRVNESDGANITYPDAYYTTPVGDEPLVVESVEIAPTPVAPVPVVAPVKKAPRVKKETTTPVKKAPAKAPAKTPAKKAPAVKKPAQKRTKK